jgi:F-type H+-transporting ATPase subunit b
MDAGILSKIGFDLEVALANFVNFLIIFLLFKIFLFKPIQDLIEKRQSEINSGLEKANLAEVSLLNAKEESDNLIKEARTKANVILSEAKSHADEVILKSSEEAKNLVSDMKNKAKQDIEEEKKSMHQEVEKEMTSLVSSLAEKVVRGESK